MLLKETYSAYQTLDANEIRKELEDSEIAEEHDLTKANNNELIYYLARNIIENALEIKTATSNNKYVGSELLLTVGGPNIHLNTYTGKLISTSWGEKEELQIHPKLAEMIDSIIEELYLY